MTWLRLLLPLCAAAAFGQSAANVLLVVNDSSSVSRRIGEYYVHARGIPLKNVCHIRTTDNEQISYAVYAAEVEKAVAACLAVSGLRESVLYVATTLGVPLRILGPGSGTASEASSVDSELTLLYAKMKNGQYPRAGGLANPFFRQRDVRFTHPQFPMYLVTRLAGYDFEDVKAMIDRGLAAKNRGKFVIDLKSDDDVEGNDWLRTAAMLLPKDRIVLDESNSVLYGQKDVIGYAGWGSNDSNRHRRLLGFQWLPGAIAMEFVSTDGRTFQRPPEAWNIGTWKDRSTWFAGSPQSMTADYIHEGASGCSGHVDEPFLRGTPHPEYVLPAYWSGRTLAESYWMGIAFVSWMNIVVGDPLCRLR